MSDKPKTEVGAETTRITEGRGHRQMDKMNMFIGWSGLLSKSIASSLRTWIRLVIPDADPWMSEEDLTKGLTWRDKLETKLINCDASLTVVTRENQSSPWLLYEAGAVSLALRGKPCCTILVDLKATDVQGPLAALQHTLVDRNDMLRLVNDLNQISNLRQGDDVLKIRFDQNWEPLESHVAKAISEHQSDAAIDQKREIRDLVEENLLLSRAMRETLDELSTTEKSIGTVSSSAIICPSCKGRHNKVIDSRLSENGSAIRRRRVCLACKRRFTTKERVAQESSERTRFVNEAPNEQHSEI